MKYLSYSLLSWACLALAQRHGEEESREMGPVAFLWPPDREWGAAVDNTAPCGSTATPGNRTNFPLVNGQVALVMQDEAYSIRISISYASDPTTNEDFVTVTDSRYIPDVDPGHECYPLPSPPDNVTEGSNATLQIQYVADFDDQGNPDSGVNETFYACADITFVPADQFTFQVPCFNTSGVDLAPVDGDGGDSSGSSEGVTEEGSSGGGGGMSGGAIAGIVVGVVAGVALVLGGAFLIWRLRQQRERLRNQQANVRAVKWDRDGGSSTKSGGGEAIGLQNLPASR